MNLHEDYGIEKKALALLTKNKPDWAKLVKECVAFANAKGGKIIIGIADKNTHPPSNQKVPDNLQNKIQSRISALTQNCSISFPIKKTASNSGEYLEFNINPSKQTLACTSDGKYFIRIADESKPLYPEDIASVLSEKSAYIWETKIHSKVPSARLDHNKLEHFASLIQKSDRVSDFVKEKDPEELMEYYFFKDGDFLTNLGILWVGTRKDRAKLIYPPTIQFIQYDATERKTYKESLDDYSLNPLEMLQFLMEKISVLNESIEISDGLYRTNVFHYEPEVRRELIANALVHRVYTMRGDITIKLFLDRLEIHSPGRLPFGVTPKNILTASIRRNELLAKVFYDLKLMEKEGSGYDKVYETLLSNGKEIPVVEEEADRVVVTINKRVVNPEVIKLIDSASKEFQLKQKELICLGLIAQHNLLSSTELSELLNITKPNGIRLWLGRLPEWHLIQKRGTGKGTEYFVNPKYLKSKGYKGKTTLKKIEAHRLKELVLQDLKTYPESSIGDIQTRIGKEINLGRIRKMLNELLENKTIHKVGTLRWTRYFLS